jgi:hypothetical protein
MWSAVGPAPQHNGNVAYSGRANAFAVSPDFDGAGTRALFVATDGGGIWRATQFTGATPVWQPLTDIVLTAVGDRSGLSAMSSVTVDPHNPRVIYAGSAAGILRSPDGGDTWALIPNTPGGATKIVVDARIGGTAVWASGGFGLFLSADGTNWASVGIGDWGFNSFSVDDMEWTISADGKTFTLFVAVHDTSKNNDGSRNGIYATITEGGVWNKTAINPINRENGQVVFPPDFGAITLGADHTPGTSVPPVAAISKKDADWRHATLLNVFKLVQGTWTPIGASLPAGLDTQGGANQPITITPAGGIYFGVSGNYSPAFFQSLDGGTTWKDITTAGVTPHVDHHGLLFTDGALYDGNDGGVWRFTPNPQNQPGGLWQHLNTIGLQTIEAQGVSIHPKDPSVILVGSQDNGIALRLNGVWSTVGGGDSGRVRFDPASASAYSEGYGWFGRSDDSGASWVGIGLPGGGEFADGIMQNYEIDPFGTGRILIAGVHGTWISSNKGGTWKKIAPSLAGDPNTVSVMAFSTEAAKIYLGFNDGRIFQTINGGGDGTAGNWTEITGGSGLGGMVVAMATDPSSADTLYVSTSNLNLWRSPDAGKTWQNITANFPRIGFTSPMALAARKNGPTVFVGTPSGVYFCQTPSAPAWGRLGAGLPFVKVTDLQYQPATDVLVAGTYGRGVFSAIVADIVPTVRIQIPKDDCGFGPVEGQTVILHSTIQPANQLATYTYLWTLTGAQFAAGEKGAGTTLNIIAPSPPQPVELSLSVSDDDGFVGTAIATFTPISFQEAVRDGIVCRLRHLIQSIYPIPPYIIRPGDPPAHPDVSFNRVFREDLERLVETAEQIASAARSALVVLKQGQDGVRIGRLPTSVQMGDRLEEAGNARRDTAPKPKRKR